MEENDIKPKSAGTPESATPETEIQAGPEGTKSWLEKADGNYFMAFSMYIDSRDLPMWLRMAVKILVFGLTLALVAIMLSWPFWFTRV